MGMAFHSLFQSENYKYLFWSFSQAQGLVWTMIWIYTRYSTLSLRDWVCLGVSIPGSPASTTIYLQDYIDYINDQHPTCYKLMFVWINSLMFHFRNTSTVLYPPRQQGSVISLISLWDWNLVLTTIILTAVSVKIEIKLLTIWNTKYTYVRRVPKMESYRLVELNVDL